MPEEPVSLAAERRKRLHESLARIVEPIREQLAEIDARLAELNAERDDLMAARREAERVLRVANPAEYAKSKPGPKSPGWGGPRTAASPERIEAVADRVVAYLEKNGSNGLGRDGISQTSLNRAMSGVGPTTLAPALELLVERGVLRLDRLTRGKGKSYAIIEGALR